jgi:4'-phosphopantetheinyl transferase
VTTTGPTAHFERDVRSAVAAPARVAVWLLHLPPDGLSELGVIALAETVDDDTRRRAARLARTDDRESTLAAHALLRRVLAPLLDRAPRDIAVVRSCATCGSTEHGKPALAPDAPARFSIAHTRRLVAVAVADRATEVGVDVERVITGTDWEPLRADTFSDREWLADSAEQDPALARTRAWARKEAIVKTTGHGLALPLRRVLPVVTDADQHGRRPWSCSLSVDGGRGIRHRLVRGWDLPSAATGGGYAASVGFENDEIATPARLTVTSLSMERDGRVTHKTNPPDMV